MSTHGDEFMVFGVTRIVFSHSGPGTTCSETDRCLLKLRLLNLITDLIQYGDGGLEIFFYIFRSLCPVKLNKF